MARCQRGGKQNGDNADQKQGKCRKQERGGKQNEGSRLQCRKENRKNTNGQSDRAKTACQCQYVLPLQVKRSGAQAVVKIGKEVRFFALF